MKKPFSDQVSTHTHTHTYPIPAVAVVVFVEGEVVLPAVLLLLLLAAFRAAAHFEVDKQLVSGPGLTTSLSEYLCAGEHGMGRRQ